VKREDLLAYICLVAVFFAAAAFAWFVLRVAPFV